ncbi:hypothetical protein PoB_007098300 [Plakobranchus ocellatus]|uniref:Uncharacterized protein n=1 Tax=Plakobranchus ocellatus TaxID=259542 RepID=A0AAV4DJL6_9GAST|nr:hypothetical protein PoB_007098300 [Plakobranchus ocellatus]
MTGCFSRRLGAERRTTTLPAAKTSAFSHRKYPEQPWSTAWFLVGLFSRRNLPTSSPECVAPLNMPHGQGMLLLLVLALQGLFFSPPQAWRTVLTVGDFHSQPGIPSLMCYVFLLGQKAAGPLYVTDKQVFSITQTASPQMGRKTFKGQGN